MDLEHDHGPSVDEATAAIVERGVRDLVARYCAAVHDADLDAFAACWCQDAEWIAKGTVIAGRPRIERVFSKLRAPFPLCVQEPLSGVVEVLDPVRAEARWIVREMQWHGDGQSVVLYGTYTDACVRGDDGRWRFASRRFEERFRGEVAAPGSFSSA